MEKHEFIAELDKRLKMCKGDACCIPFMVRDTMVDISSEFELDFKLPWFGLPEMAPNAWLEDYYSWREITLQFHLNNLVLDVQPVYVEETDETTLYFISTPELLKEFESISTGKYFEWEVDGMYIVAYPQSYC